MPGARRVSRVQRQLLLFLTHTTPSHGFAMASALGLWTATVYPSLQRLEEQGLVASAMEQGDPAALGRPLRRLYRLTADGARVAATLDANQTGRMRTGAARWA